ncbi:MAG TPA: Fe-S cluster assembly protein SufD [Candidatus Polarisedimenticolaceae bacterium]|nr:Fe-S cluster assembly protein SufD [Candidatus Polarisedimenticolaceae bacterium]
MSLRADARARFETLGIPKPTEEDWRQTNVQPVAPFATAVAPAVRLDAATLEAASPLASLLPVRVVLVNGRFDRSLSRLTRLQSNVRVESMTDHDRLASAAAFDDRAFVALNTALFQDGVLISIPDGVELKEPVHVLHVAVPSDEPRSIHPRVLVVAGAGGRGVVVETYVTVGNGPYLTNAVTEILVADDAHVEHVKVQSEGEGAWHVATIAGRQGRDARLHSHNVTLGAKLARNDIGSRLLGQGAECHLYGLYVADGTQHVDNHTALDHAVPHCPSWEMYKGVLAGSARAVFNGRIIVRPNAQKTDAKQSNKNLLLSDAAVVHTRPQLEIFANDVKCTHGATIGRLDETSLFYLRTRGIGADEARDMLVHAFAGDVLQKIPVPALAERLSAGLAERLGGRP